jgi:hypothetical protein
MQSVPIITSIVSLNLAHGEVYSIQHYVIKFVSDLHRSLVFSGYSRSPLPITDLPTLTILAQGSRFFGLTYALTIVVNFLTIRQICGISGKFWVPVHHFIAVPYIIDVSAFPVIKKTMSKRQNFDNKPKIDLKC